MLISIADITGVEIDLTGTCNLKCPMCTRNYKHAEHLSQKNIRPVDEIIKQLDKFTQLEVVNLAGAVSEPTMYKHLTLLLKYLNSRDLFYEIYTNGNTHNNLWWTELGNIIPEKCKVIFTVCGSTQELHEKYRIGSSLNEILQHADAYRQSGKKNDYIQHIQFEYNKDDVHTDTMKGIIDQFNNVEYVKSDGVRLKNEHIVQFSDDIMPVTKRANTIKRIYDSRPRPESQTTCNIECLSLRERIVHMDQYGNIHPCHVHAQFSNKAFDEEVFDYTDIINFAHEECFVCSRTVNKLIDLYDLPKPMDKIEPRE